MVQKIGFKKADLPDTLRRIFYKILESSSVLKIIKRENLNLRMDATYFAQFCLVAYQGDFDGYTQLIRFTDGEHFEEIKEDLSNFLLLRVKLESITTDGEKSILKVIRKTDENILMNSPLITFTKRG